MCLSQQQEPNSDRTDTRECDVAMMVLTVTFTPWAAVREDEGGWGVGKASECLKLKEVL